VRVGLYYCGDPEAFYGWPVETQERVLGWLRAQQPKGKPGRRVPGIETSGKGAREFWGL
jgi:hypothetical protein